MIFFSADIAHRLFQFHLFPSACSRCARIPYPLIAAVASRTCELNSLASALDEVMVNMLVLHVVLLLHASIFIF